MIKRASHGLIGLTLTALAATGIATATAATHTHAEGVHHDTQPPEITQWMKKPSILVFSKTLSWRHNEGIAGADLYFADLASSRGMGFFSTVNGAVFNDEQLARFDVVVFNNMTGDTLSPAQEQAFQKWLENGGALIALHGSGDASHTDWPWYDEQVIGPEFIGHPMRPQFQEARVANLAPTHPIMNGIPAEWLKVDEWYSFEALERMAGAKPLLGLDESTFIAEIREPDGSVKDIRMGDSAQEHPIAWSRCLGEGRVVYSAVGHSTASYRDEVYRRFLLNTFEWVRTRESGAGC